MTRFFRAASAVAVALIAAAFISAVPAAAQGAGSEIGLLTCKSIPGTRVNLVVHSRIDVTCEFKTPGGKIEPYKGESGIGFGLDLNWEREEQIAFSVINMSKDRYAHAQSLAGQYYGGKASITVAYGAGAAALVGGSGDNFALQPLALETSTGYGIAGGVGFLFLEPDPSRTPTDPAILSPPGPATPAPMTAPNTDG